MVEIFMIYNNFFVYLNSLFGRKYDTYIEMFVFEIEMQLVLC